MKRGDERLQPSHPVRRRVAHTPGRAVGGVDAAAGAVT